MLEDKFFQEPLQRFETAFTVYKFTTTYTWTFTLMPADKTWLYDPFRNPLHNYPANHQFEVNIACWRLQSYEIDFTCDDTEKVMIIVGHTLPCNIADSFCKQTIKTHYTLVWFSDVFCLIFTLQDIVG